jgi:ComEC/Rec2-related protein
MLAVIVWFALRALRVPRSWAVFCTIPLLFFYVAVTGLKMGSIRSATMTSVLLLGLVLFRRSPLLNTLAFAAFLQLAVDPEALFSPGWQFSYTVVFAILLAAGPIEQWVGSLYVPDPFIPPKLLTFRERFGFDSWKRLAGLAAVSAAAWIGSLIPTIVYFHLISFSALGANMLAVPLAFGVLSLGVLSLMAGTFSLWVAGAFNNANWLITKLLLLVVQSSALIPGGHWFIGPPGKPYPEMTILDLRGASCAVIRSSGDFALVDSGRANDARVTVLPFLESSGANSIRRALITRSDAAHLGGLPLIKQESSIFSMALPPVDGRSSVAKALLSQEHSASLKRLSEGDRWRLLERIRAETIYPPREKPSDFLMPRLLIGNTRILMLPKMTPEVIKDLSVIPQESLKAEILILPLGGCDFSSTLALIRKVSPRLLISPVDRHSGLRVPSGEWRGILKDEGIGFMRQDETGAVTIVSNKRETAVHPFLKKDQKMILR